MNYFVIGPDGREYGPAPLDSLRQWVNEHRVTPQTQLRCVETGVTSAASAVPGLFDPVAPVPPPAQAPHAPPSVGPYSSNPYGSPQGAYYRPTVNNDSMGPLWGVIARSAAAIVFFFIFHGIGVIFAIYAMINAVQIKSNGSKYGWVAIGFAATALAAVVIGWIMRLGGSGV